MKKLNFLFLLVLLNSCGLINHNRFTYYKQVSKIEALFRTDGVYYRFSEFHAENGDDRYFAGLYFFYKDGTVISNSVRMKNSLLKRC